MKCFVRSSDVDQGRDLEVLAFYDDDTEVPADAHGPGAVIITVAHGLLRMHAEPGGTPGLTTIPANWRALSAKVFPLGERTKSVYELVMFMLDHGPDLTKWPEQARHRMTEIRKRWEP